MRGPKRAIPAVLCVLSTVFACDGVGTTGPHEERVQGALSAVSCRNVAGTGMALAGVGGTLEGDLTGTFDVPTDVKTDVHGPGLFLQTQFTDFETNLGAFTTEDAFVFGPLPAPGESTSRFDGRLEIAEGPDVDEGLLHFHGTIAFTVIFVGDQPVVTLRADFDYRGRVCAA